MSNVVDNPDEVLWRVGPKGERLGPVVRSKAHNVDTSIGDPNDWEVIHEEVGLMVVSSDDKTSVLFQLRAKDKKMMPNTWSTGVGGHVEWREGEESEVEAIRSREEAVFREAEEEIGLEGFEVTYMGRFLDVGPREARWKYMYRADVPESYSFRIDPSEVQKVGFFNEEELERAIDAGEEFYEPFVELVRAFWAGKLDEILKK